MQKQPKLPVFKTALAVLTLFPVLIRTAPLAIAVGSVMLVAEDVAQFLAGLTAADTTLVFSDWRLGPLLAIKIMALWLLSVAAYRALAAPQGGIWRVDRPAAVMLFLMLVLVVLEHGFSHTVKAGIGWLSDALPEIGPDRYWHPAAIGIEIVGFLAWQWFDARLTTTLYPALALGDRTASFARAWRETRGNGWRVVITPVLAVLPIGVAHLVIDLAHRGVSADAGGVAWLLLDGVLEIIYVLIALCVIAEMYRWLTGAIRDNG